MEIIDKVKVTRIVSYFGLNISNSIFEAKLVSALEELQKERKNHRKIIGKLEDANEIIRFMKVEIEESNKVSDDLES